MKGQQIGLLLRVVWLERHESSRNARTAWPNDWQETELVGDDLQHVPQPGMDWVGDLASAPSYTARTLEEQTGISKSQIALSLNRCIEIGLAKMDRRHGVPRASKRALCEFIVYSLRYVFPARHGELTRGIATSFAAPAL